MRGRIPVPPPNERVAIAVRWQRLCKYCGQPIPPKAKICPKCGTEQESHDSPYIRE